MKIDEIKTIVRLMSENDLTEFKIEAEEYNLCIRRGGSSVAVQLPAPVQLAPAAAPAPAPAPAPTPDSAPAHAEKTVDAPLVGTFYRSSSPDAAPFVKVGDRVTAEETVIGIIEAMKVMNEIKSDVSGVVKDILVKDAQPVEYGQPLFVIE